MFSYMTEIPDKLTRVSEIMDEDSTNVDPALMFALMATFKQQNDILDRILKEYDDLHNPQPFTLLAIPKGDKNGRKH